MILTAADKKAVDMARDAIRNCQRYNTAPAPYFPLLIRMYHELEDAGMIQWSEGVRKDV